MSREIIEQEEGESIRFAEMTGSSKESQRLFPDATEKPMEGGKEFDLSNAETDIPEETGSDHGHNFVDKEDEQNFAEEAPPAARRDEPGPITLFITATASRRGPTQEGSEPRHRSAPPARREHQPTTCRPRDFYKGRSSFTRTKFRPRLAASREEGKTSS